MTLEQSHRPGSQSPGRVFKTPQKTGIKTMSLECHFCGKTVPDVETAIENDWSPSFWKPDDDCETCDPVCAECVNEHLEVDPETGELIQVTDGDEKPIAIRPMPMESY